MPKPKKPLPKIEESSFKDLFFEASEVEKLISGYEESIIEFQHQFADDVRHNKCTSINLSVACRHIDAAATALINCNKFAPAFKSRVSNLVKTLNPIYSEICKTIDSLKEKDPKFRESSADLKPLIDNLRLKLDVLVETSLSSSEAPVLSEDDIRLGKIAIGQLELVDRISSKIINIQESIFYRDSVEKKSIAEGAVFKLPCKKAIDASATAEDFPLPEEVALGVYKDIEVETDSIEDSKVKGSLKKYYILSSSAAVYLHLGEIRQATQSITNSIKIYTENSLEALQFPIHRILFANIHVQNKQYSEAVSCYLEAYKHARANPSTITLEAFETLRFQLINSIFSFAKNLDEKGHHEFYIEFSGIIETIQDSTSGNLEFLFRLSNNLRTHKDTKSEQLDDVKAHYLENIDSFHPLARIFYLTQLANAHVLLDVEVDKLLPLIHAYKEWMCRGVSICKSLTVISEHEPVRALSIMLLNQGDYDSSLTAIQAAIDSGDSSPSAALLKALAITKNENIFEKHEEKRPQYLEAINALKDFISFPDVQASEVPVVVRMEYFNSDTNNYLVLINYYLGLLEKTGADNKLLRQGYAFVGKNIKAFSDNDLVNLIGSQSDFQLLNQIKIVSFSAYLYRTDKDFRESFSKTVMESTLSIINCILESRKEIINYPHSEACKKILLSLIQFREYTRAEALYREMNEEFTLLNKVEYSSAEKCYLAKMLVETGKEDALEVFKSLDEKDLNDTLKAKYARLLLVDAIAKKLEREAEEYKHVAKLFGEVKKLDGYEDSYIFALKVINDKKTLEKVLAKAKTRSDSYFEAMCHIHHENKNYKGVIEASDAFFALEKIDQTRAQNVANAHIHALIKLEKYDDIITKALEFQAKGYEIEMEDKNLVYASCIFRNKAVPDRVTLEMLTKLGVEHSHVETFAKNLIVVNYKTQKKNFKEIKKHVSKFAEIFSGKDLLKILVGHLGITETDVKIIRAKILFDTDPLAALNVFQELFLSGCELDPTFFAINKSQFKLLEGFNSEFVSKFTEEIKLKLAKYLCLGAKKYHKSLAVFQTLNLEEINEEAREAYDIALAIDKYSKANYSEVIEIASKYNKEKPQVTINPDLAQAHVASLANLGELAELYSKWEYYSKNGIVLNLEDSSECIAESFVKQGKISYEKLLKFKVKEADLIKSYKEFMVSLVQSEQFEKAKELYLKFSIFFPEKEFDDVFSGTVGISGEDVLFIETLILIDRGEYKIAYDECLKLLRSCYSNQSLVHATIESSFKSGYYVASLNLLKTVDDPNSVAASLNTTTHKICVQAIKESIEKKKYDYVLMLFPEIEANFTCEDLKDIFTIEVSEKAVDEMKLQFARVLSEAYVATHDNHLREIAEPICEKLHSIGYKQAEIEALGDVFLSEAL